MNSHAIANTCYMPAGMKRKKIGSNAVSKLASSVQNMTSYQVCAKSEVQW